MDDTQVLIVDQPFPADGHDTPFGQRWGGYSLKLTRAQLSALQAGKLLALDVANEYVIFLSLGDMPDMVTPAHKPQS